MNIARGRQPTICTAAHTQRIHEAAAAPGTAALWLLWFAVWCCILAAPAQAGDGPRHAQSQLDFASVMQRIISYTAWPSRHESLRVCVSRTALDGAEMARQIATPAGGARRLEVMMIDADQALPTDCHVVYLDGWPAEALRATLRDNAARPVLTLGRGADFCSDGGMFCLERGPDGTRFEVNLDAVARSGLRVHPQVLRLARPATRGVS